MKQFLYSVLLLAAISLVLYSCSSGAYTANSSSPSNSGINPLNPLSSSQFTWTGSGEFSALVNGQSFVSDSALWSFDSGANVIYAAVGKQTFLLSLSNVYGGDLYNLGRGQYSCIAALAVYDSPTTTTYYSYLGNSAEVYIEQNDSVLIEGKFYFEGVSTTGQIVTVTQGFFDVPKP